MKDGVEYSYDVCIKVSRKQPIYVCEVMVKSAYILPSPDPTCGISLVCLYKVSFFFWFSKISEKRRMQPLAYDRVTILRINNKIVLHHCFCSCGCHNNFLNPLLLFLLSLGKVTFRQISGYMSINENIMIEQEKKKIDK